MKWTDIWRIFPAIALLSVLAVGSTWFLNREDEIAGFAKLIDGDSLRIDRVEIRLKGIDAPELFQACHNDQGVYACGRKAKDSLERIIGAHVLFCKSAEADRYRRRLARCTAGGRDIARLMVLEGMAVSYNGYTGEEEAARTARRGLWAGTFERPAQWRAFHPHER